MARRKGGGDVSEAFDLFLDTISNAFGGVIFISLLACVLLQLSRPAPTIPEPASEDSSDGRGALVVIQEEIEALRKVKVSLVKQIEALGAGSDPELVRKFLEFAAQERQERDRTAAFAAEARRVDGEKNALAQAKAALESRIADLTKTVAGLEASLAAVAPAQEHRLRVPAHRKTTKTQVAVLLKNGRLVFRALYDGRGGELGPNDAEVAEGSVTPEQATSGAVASLVPRPGAGFAVDGSDRFRSELRRRLKEFDPGATYVVAAVWPETFEGFELLRNELIDLGFGYNLVLLNPEEPVLVGAAEEGEL